MKKRVLALLLAALLLAALAGCGKKTEPEVTPLASLPQRNAPQEGDTIAVIETSKGTIKAVLYRDRAPLACDNFMKLADAGSYDGLLLHKVIADFVIQTGDPSGTGTGGEAASGAGFACEYDDKLHNFTGALGMAADTAALNHSQFYIVAGGAVSEDYIAAMQAAGYAPDVIEAYRALGGQPSLDYVYTVFGQVYEGLELVAELSNLKADKWNRPLDDVTVKSVTVTTYTAG